MQTLAFSAILASLMLTACGREGRLESSHLKSEESIANRHALVDQSRCPTARGDSKMGDCAFETIAVASAESYDAAVPVRTTLTAIRSGICSSAFRLQYLVRDARGAEIGRFDFLAGESHELRRDASAPFGSILVEMAPDWWSLATLPSTCRIELEIAIDRPVIAASTVIAWKISASALRAEAADAVGSAEAFERLLDFAKAFGFVAGLVDRFHHQLTDELYAELREGASAYQSTIEMIVQRNDAGLTFQQRAGLNRLHLLLGSVDDPTRWKNEDGTYKSVADFLSDQDRARLEVARTLCTPEKLVEYKTNQVSFAEKSIRLGREAARFDALVDQYPPNS